MLLSEKNNVPFEFVQLICHQTVVQRVQESTYLQKNLLKNFQDFQENLLFRMMPLKKFNGQYYFMKTAYQEHYLSSRILKDFETMLSFDLIAKNDVDIFLEKVSLLFINNTIIVKEDKSSLKENEIVMESISKKKTKKPLVLYNILTQGYPSVVLSVFQVLRRYSNKSELIELLLKIVLLTKNTLKLDCAAALCLTLLNQF
jgi:hypothetical protein